MNAAKRAAPSMNVRATMPSILKDPDYLVAGHPPTPTPDKPQPVVDAKKGADGAGQPPSKTKKVAAKPQAKTWLDNASAQGKTAVIAHRGQHEGASRDNDMPSLKRAAKDGASDGVEMDIRRLKDGTMVIHHDAELEDGPLQGRKLSDLSKKDLKKYSYIPTLEQWSKQAGKQKTNVIAEFKESGYEREALDVLQKHIAPKHLVAMSFDAEAVKGIHKADPNVEVGLVPSRKDGGPSAAKQVAELGFQPDFIEINSVHLNEPTLAAMHKAGIDVIVGTDNPYTQNSLLYDTRVSALLTNLPTQVARLKR